METGAERRIALVPPFSERFSAGKAGAFSLFIGETTPLCRYRGSVTVLGAAVEAPLGGIDFRAVDARGPFWLSRNRRAARNVVRLLMPSPPALVEVFNRPEVFKVIADRLPNTPIVLHLGNDPLEMRRGRSRHIRQAILERAAGVWCCSQYICDRFLDGLTGPAVKVVPLYSGAARPAERPAKERRIAFVGRMIEEKGALDLAEALRVLLPRFPDWKVSFVGANRPGDAAGATAYEQKIAACLEPVSSQVTFHGFVPAARVIEILAQAAIVAVPSKWREPMGRTAIEGLAAGCAVIAGGGGGLPEIVEGRGILLPEVSAASLERALEGLMGAPQELARYQDLAWNNFPFDLSEFVNRYDALRASAMQRAR